MAGIAAVGAADGSVERRRSMMRSWSQRSSYAYPGGGGPATLQGITVIVKRKTNQQEKAQSTDVVTDTSLPNRPLDPQRSVFALEHLGVRYRGKRQSGESAEISQRGTGREAPSHSASSHAYRLLGAALVPKARLLYRSRHIRRQCWSTPHTET